MDGNSKDKTRELAENVGARVHLEERKGMDGPTEQDLLSLMRT